MRIIAIVLTCLVSVNAFADNFAVYGGKYVAGHRSGTSSDSGWNFGGDYAFGFVGPLSASIVLDHTSYSVAGRANDHITSIMFAPGFSVPMDRIRVFASLGLGLQINSMSDWAFMSGTNRISYGDSAKIALVVAPRAGVDFNVFENYFVGVQGAFHYSKYTQQAQSTDASNVVTQLPNENISQSFFSIGLRLGLNF